MTLTIGPADAEETAGLFVAPQFWADHFAWARLPLAARDHALRVGGAQAIRAPSGEPLLVFWLHPVEGRAVDELGAWVQQPTGPEEYPLVAPALKMLKRALDAHPRDMIATVEHEGLRFTRPLRLLGFTFDGELNEWRRRRS